MPTLRSAKCKTNRNIRKKKKEEIKATQTLSPLSLPLPLRHPQHRRARKQQHKPDGRPHLARRALAGPRVDARGVAAEVPRADVRQLAVLVEEDGVGADGGVLGAEGAEVRVAVDEVLVVQPLGRRVVEVLRRLEVLVRVGVLRDPDWRLGEAVAPIQVLEKAHS